MPIPDPKTRYRIIRRITLIGAAINVILAFTKIIFGVIGHSHALLADGVHSIADLLTDFLVLCVARYGNREADHDHPYGHGRLETAGTMLLALLLILTGIGIVLDAGQHVWTQTTTVIPDQIVLWIALCSVLANEVLFRYSLGVAKQIKSSLLNANAWHHRSDAAASLVVVVGVVGAMIGFPLCDAIAAILVGILIIKMGWQLGWSSIRELVDTGLDHDTLQRMQQVIRGVSGVGALHQLRTRTMGHAILADVHILVSPVLSVSEGHFIGQQVYQALKQHIPTISDVIVHVDPEDDEVVQSSDHLPTREQLLSDLNVSWKHLPGADALISVTLHYLAGKIFIEILLPLSVLDQGYSAQQLLQAYRAASSTHTHVFKVELRFCLSPDP